MFESATEKMFVARRQPPDSPGAEKLLNAILFTAREKRQAMLELPWKILSNLNDFLPTMDELPPLITISAFCANSTAGNSSDKDPRVNDSTL
jgi:hypothetical protein